MKQASFLALAFLAAGIAIGAGIPQLTLSPAGAGMSCHTGAQAMSRLELIFGTSRSGGEPVTDAEWKAFLADEVSPRFPDGLTVLRGPGQWRASDGRFVEEESRILIIWHLPTTSTDAHIEAIRDTYKKRFSQESVMRVEGTSCVSF